MRLVQTCGACPEQYDVFQGKELVGYIRLRHGLLSVRCPWSGGEEVYSRVFDDPLQGIFADEYQREEELNKAKSAIREWLNNRDKRK